jgi:hypothetical protein
VARGTGVLVALLVQGLAAGAGSQPAHTAPLSRAMPLLGPGTASSRRSALAPIPTPRPRSPPAGTRRVSRLLLFPVAELIIGALTTLPLALAACALLLPSPVAQGFKTVAALSIAGLGLYCAFVYSVLGAISRRTAKLGLEYVELRREEELERWAAGRPAAAAAGCHCRSLPGLAGVRVALQHAPRRSTAGRRTAVVAALTRPPGAPAGTATGAGTGRPGRWARLTRARRPRRCGGTCSGRWRAARRRASGRGTGGSTSWRARAPRKARACPAAARRPQRRWAAGLLSPALRARAALLAAWALQRALPPQRPTRHCRLRKPRPACSPS